MQNTARACICALLLLGCDEVEPVQPEYRVQTDLLDDDASSLVFFDGDLVATASLSEGQLAVSSVASEREIATVAPAGLDPWTDPDAWDATIAGASEGLRLMEEADEDGGFRTLDSCGAAFFDGPAGSTCAISWCGTSCVAFDCAGGWLPEIHLISGCD